MKKSLLALSMVLLASQVAGAAELCGTLTSYSVTPHCNPGTMCPMFIRLQYAIKDNGQRVNIQTSESSILTQFGQFKGDYVCATGVYEGSGFSVDSIQLNDR